MTVSQFIEELHKLNISINQQQLMQLEKYYELLISWNDRINLTSITKKEDVYLKHFYDSITIIKIIDLTKCESLCDIGTGAGFPGLVLKILFSNLQVTLIDSLNKRISFLNEVIKELGLKEITTICTRAEEYAKTNREIFDVVTCRAVAQLPILLEYSIPLVKTGKYFIPLKGNIFEEIKIENALKQLKIKNEEMICFTLPYENSQRTIIRFKKQEKTPLKYPRPYKQIKKMPL